MTWKASLGASLLAAFALASCSSSDLGTGINTVDREYANSVKETHDAALNETSALYSQKGVGSVPHRAL